MIWHAHSPDAFCSCSQPIIPQACPHVKLHGAQARGHSEQPSCGGGSTATTACYEILTTVRARQTPSAPATGKQSVSTDIAAH